MKSIRNSIILFFLCLVTIMLLGACNLPALLKLNNTNDPLSANYIAATPKPGSTKTFKIVVGNYIIGGYLYISTDGGATWTQTGGPHDWNAVSMSQDGLKLVAAPCDAPGTIYNSLDGGLTWNSHSISPLTSVNWSNVVSSANGSNVYATVYNPSTYIYNSVDFGNTWNPIFSISSQGWGGLSVSDDGLRLQATQSSSAINTTWTFNYLAPSWVTAPLGMPISAQFNCIASNSTGTQLLVGGSGPGTVPLYLSTLSGSSWNAQSAPGSKYWCSVTSSADGMHLIAADNNGFTAPGGNIWTSSDGGTTWLQSVSAGTRVWRKIAASPDGMFLAAGVNGGYIYTSTDYGITWVEHQGAGSITGAGIAVAVY